MVVRNRRLVILAVLLGLLFGISAYTFLYAEGFSYFGTDPEVCINCHIMNPQYDSWLKSSHHAVATCVDCHLPHTFLGKYYTKASNGYHHSKAFTLQDFHEPIMIKEKNSQVLQDNCVYCHRDMIHDVYQGRVNPLQCIHCHRAVGHGTLPTSIGGSD